MHLFFIHPTKKKEDDTGKHSLVLPQNQEYSTNEGSEFLDDAISAEDLPASDREENSTVERS